MHRLAFVRRVWMKAVVAHEDTLTDFYLSEEAIQDSSTPNTEELGAVAVLMVFDRMSAMAVSPCARPLFQPSVGDDRAVEKALGFKNGDIPGSARWIDQRRKALRNTIGIRHTNLREW